MQQRGYEQHSRCLYDTDKRLKATVIWLEMHTWEQMIKVLSRK